MLARIIGGSFVIWYLTVDAMTFGSSLPYIVEQERDKRKIRKGHKILKPWEVKKRHKIHHAMKHKHWRNQGLEFTQPNIHGKIMFVKLSVSCCLGHSLSCLMKFSGMLLTSITLTKWYNEEITVLQAPKKFNIHSGSSFRQINKWKS